ncbi:class I SAM-dependent methyltransferase [Actinosynnema sp. NPDC002837]
MYDAEFADAYDAIYQAHKDYRAEADVIRGLVLDRCPHATTLLDLGCGTGSHLVHLAEQFDVVGVDLSAAMVEHARAKLPDVPIHCGDMRDVALDREFDAVCSMYSSVGYLPGLAGLRAAAENMVRHLSPKGVLVVEPWILAEHWNGGELVTATFEHNGVVVSRMGRWKTVKARSVVEMHYLVSGADGDNIRYFTDRQSLGLYTRAEYEAAFADAGCPVEYVEGGGHAARGLFVGTRTP